MVSNTTNSSFALRLSTDTLFRCQSGHFIVVLEANRMISILLLQEWI